MSHAWVVPGCESPWGVFSGATPVLDDDLGENVGQGRRRLRRQRRPRPLQPRAPATSSNTPTTVGGSIELAVRRLTPTLRSW